MNFEFRSQFNIIIALRFQQTYPLTVIIVFYPSSSLGLGIVPDPADETRIRIQIQMRERKRVCSLGGMLSSTLGFVYGIRTEQVPRKRKEKKRGEKREVDTSRL